jgi:hypothetical protein
MSKVSESVISEKYPAKRQRISLMKMKANEYRNNGNRNIINEVIENEENVAILKEENINAMKISIIINKRSAMASKKENSMAIESVISMSAASSMAKI